MAEFRRNHQRNSARPFQGNIIRLVLFFLAIGLLVLVAWRYLGSSEGWSEPETSTRSSSASSDATQRELIPLGSDGDIYDKRDYVLSYVESREQPEWVAYTLTADKLDLPSGKRPRNFSSDRSIRTGSAVDDDYRGSGYSRGHMVPSRDMSWDAASQLETFQFSNICPQIIPYNGGVWRELEEATRYWVRRHGELAIVSGALYGGKNEEIGRNRVDVPSAFYKVLLDRAAGESIAFLIPHAVQEDHLRTFAMSVDELEERVDLDFWADLLSASDQSKIESNYELSEWPIDEKRYQKRIKDWNHR